MKALTLRHPWPFAIAYWGKRIENRGWQPRTELKIGQRFAIHGGRSPSDAKYRCDVRDTVEQLLQRFGVPSQPGFPRDRGGFIGIDRFVKPGIVCTAVLKEIVTESADPWFEGPFGWQLDDVIVLPEPIPCPGAQGLWTIPAHIEAAIRKAGG